MTRSEFEHAIRAAGGVLGTTELLVIGSQAIHATVDGDLPEAAQRSIEVDIVAFDDPDGAKADLIDGSIGEASMFHATFGYYAQGVSESTAILPGGWRDRLLQFGLAGHRRRGGLVSGRPRLWISKAIANREKDVEFCRALLSAGIVDRATLHSRLEAVPALEEERRRIVARRIDQAD